MEHIGPSTDDLPFLFLHGAWVWKVLVVTIVLLVAGLTRLVRRRIARTAARKLVNGMRVRVRGTLIGTGSEPMIATVVARRAGTGEVATASWHRPSITIASWAGPIELVGDIEVVAGDRAHAARRGVPRATTTTMLGSFRRRVDWLHRRQLRKTAVSSTTLATLAPDTEVVADGVLEAGTLVPATGAQTIRIAARRPRGAARPLPAIAAVAIAGVTGFLAYSVLNGLGEHWTEACRTSAFPTDRFADVGNFHPCALAAAMPRDRSSLAGYLEAALEQEKTSPLDDHPLPYHDRRSLNRLLALDEMSGGCRQVVRRLENANRFEELAVWANRCHDAREEFTARLALGELAEATTVSIPAGDDDFYPPLRAFPLVATGRWADAATAADADADAIARSDTRSGKWRAAALRCVAELFRGRAGDRGALDRLRARVAGEDRAACQASLWALEGRADGYQLLMQADLVVLSPDVPIGDTHLWGADSFAAWLARPTTSGTLPSANEVGWRAIGHLIHGDANEAAQDSGLAAQLAPELAVLPSLIAMYGDHPPPDVARSAGILDQLKDPELDAAQAAIQGDGRPLAMAIGANDYWTPIAAMAVLPRVTTGRDALARELAWAPRNELRGDPWVFPLRAYVMREVLLRAGVPAEAARWNASFERWDAVLRDPDRLLALVLYTSVADVTRACRHGCQ